MGYPRKIVHGFLVVSGLSRLLGMKLPGPNTVLGSLKVDLLKPTFVGETLLYTVRVVRCTPSVRSVKLDVDATNVQGETVMRGCTVCIFRDASAQPESSVGHATESPSDESYSWNGVLAP